MEQIESAGALSTELIRRLAKAPRSGKHAEKPGSYQLVPRLLARHVDPGDYLCVDFFMAGYGEIGPAKIGVWPTTNLFDGNLSRWRSGMVQKTKDELHFSFASEEHSGSVDGITVFLYGLHINDWESATMFLDLSESDPPKVATEADLEGSPFATRLKLRTDAKAGHYSLPVAFTYFNGERWSSSTVMIDFVITSWVQRHELKLQIAGAIAAITAVASTLVAAISAL
ncbi:hypothetical protein LK996_09070 [Lysobacter sp. A6]|uniref:DUF8164 domain-containing protein n=1 Tax=Noviluteimonas lactosilytica TaxID=2888523 RepID=A0ABS8JI81_9GAMM|nr:hypothetical protein [Lysobacter lactosilyticus]MCC8363225.1 hypothetical protein [Lysobacter lactosilyticus]